MIDSASMDANLEARLAEFGLESFRPGQKDVIETILSGRDCLCVMPTGGGKSLCYQLPAMAAGGVTLVISPLIALMKDQVDQLTAHGFPVTFINSTLSQDEVTQRLDDVALGRYRLVYVVPERFRSPRFLRAVQRAEVKILAVDEAHCISEWGHDFRPDYARLGQYRHEIGDPPTIALTATATEHVRQDIVERLALRDPAVFVKGFSRPNLSFGVRRVTGEKERSQAMAQFLEATPGSGIIYASSRRRTEDLADFLSNQVKRRIVPYHAGLTPEQRTQTQEAFISGKAPIIVATSAFGMGIDKADVRFVIHANMPGSLEAYYQEAGRAGRDGDPAKCQLYYHSADRRILEYFIENAYPSPDVVAEVWDFLRSLDDDPIEMTQQQIKEQLSLSHGADAVGTCEELLDRAGVIERLAASENVASVRIISDLPTIVDMLPKKAERRRRVLQAVERMIGQRRGEQVFFRPQELAAAVQMNPRVLATALRGLNKLEAFTYVPPFRGRAVRVLDRKRGFDDIPIDFRRHEERKKAEYEKIDRVIRFVHTTKCRQGDIVRYFGDEDQGVCGSCDNCRSRGAGASLEDGSQTVRREGGETSTASNDPLEEAVLTIVRMALSGVARASKRCACGKRLVAQMLCGSEAAAIRRLGFHQLSTFGLLGDMRQTEVVDLLDGLVAAGYLKQVEPTPMRPVLELTERGEALMWGKSDERLMTMLPPDLIKTLRMHGVSYMDAAPASDDRRVGRCPTDEPPTDAANEEPVETPHEPAHQDDGHPSYHWTAQVLNAGFDVDQCCSIRRLDRRHVMDDIARAVDAGLPIPTESVIAPELAEQIETLITDGIVEDHDLSPVKASDLMSSLPDGTPYDAVAFYLRKREG